MFDIHEPGWKWFKAQKDNHLPYELCYIRHFPFSYLFPPYVNRDITKYFLQLEAFYVIDIKSLEIIGQKPRSGCVFVFIDAINTQPLYYSYITPWGTTAQSPETGNWEFSHISSATPQYLTGTLKCTLFFFQVPLYSDCCHNCMSKRKFQTFTRFRDELQKLLGHIHTKRITYNPFCTDF